MCFIRSMSMSMSMNAQYYRSAGCMIAIKVTSKHPYLRSLIYADQTSKCRQNECRCKAINRTGAWLPRVHGSVCRSATRCVTKSEIIGGSALCATPRPACVGEVPTTDWLIDDHPATCRPLRSVLQAERPFVRSSIFIKCLRYRNVSY